MSQDRPTLLIIDDEPLMARFVADAADDAGFETIVTHDDEEFRNIVRQAPPHAISLDLGMPKADGIELLRFLGEAQFSGPVMVISGFDRRVIQTASRLGRELGLDMHGPVEKPARLALLAETLNEMKPKAA